MGKSTGKDSKGDSGSEQAAPDESRKGGRKEMGNGSSESRFKKGETREEKIGWSKNRCRYENYNAGGFWGQGRKKRKEKNKRFVDCEGGIWLTKKTLGVDGRGTTGGVATKKGGVATTKKKKMRKKRHSKRKGQDGIAELHQERKNRWGGQVHTPGEKQS